MGKDNGPADPEDESDSEKAEEDHDDGVAGFHVGYLSLLRFCLLESVGVDV